MASVSHFAPTGGAVNEAVRRGKVGSVASAAVVRWDLREAGGGCRRGVRVVFRKEPFCEGNWPYDSPDGRRNGSGSAQIAFAKGDHGVGVGCSLRGAGAGRGALARGDRADRAASSPVRRVPDGDLRPRAAVECGAPRRRRLARHAGFLGARAVDGQQPSGVTVGVLRLGGSPGTRCAARRGPDERRQDARVGAA